VLDAVLEVPGFDAAMVSLDEHGGGTAASATRGMTPEEARQAALAAFGAGDRTRALLSGFQLQLAKPVRPAELVAAVANLAGRTRPAPQPQEAQA